nr:hypothetical protein [Klebsiella pneumoniae]
MAPDSTFKIALSLMAFDAEIIDQKTIFKWDKPQRNGDLEQQSYTKDVDAIFCCLGFARNNPKIGLNKIKNYLKDLIMEIKTSLEIKKETTDYRSMARK